MPRLCRSQVAPQSGPRHLSLSKSALSLQTRSSTSTCPFSKSGKVFNVAPATGFLTRKFDGCNSTLPKSLNTPSNDSLYQSTYHCIVQLSARALFEGTGKRNAILVHIFFFCRTRINNPQASVGMMQFYVVMTALMQRTGYRKRRWVYIFRMRHCALQPIEKGIRTSVTCVRHEETTSNLEIAHHGQIIRDCRESDGCETLWFTLTSVVRRMSVWW